MKTGTIFAIEHPDFGMKFIGYTGASLDFRLGQIRAQTGRDPVLLWIQSLREGRWLLTIRPLLCDCPYDERRERIRGFVLEHAAAGAQLLNDRCNKRVHRGTGSPIASELTFVYCLRHPVTRDVRYVGKTVDLREREKGHRQLGKTRCDNWKRSLLADGLWPDMEVLEAVPVGANWVEREQYWIAHFKAQGANLTNLTNGGEGTHGRVITDAYREKLRKAFTGRPIPQEQREQISKSLTGKIQSKETVERRMLKWAERRVEAGKPPLQRFDTYEEYRAAGRKSFNISRQKKRHANGVAVMGSEEHRQKQAEKSRAHYESLSGEQKEAIAEQLREVRVNSHGAPNNKGRKFGPQSPERRAAQSARLKAYIASLTPEQREARLAPARKAQPAAWKAIMASKTKEERKAMMAAADAANPMKQKALQGG